MSGAFTLFTGSFEAGVHWQFYPGKSAKFELISSFALASQSSFVSYKKQKTNEILCDVTYSDHIVHLMCMVHGLQLQY